MKMISVYKQDVQLCSHKNHRKESIDRKAIPSQTDESELKPATPYYIEHGGSDLLEKRMRYVRNFGRESRTTGLYPATFPIPR